MTDKKPVKRGVLSGLMGLFGEENADGQPTVASSPAAPPSATPQMASVIRNQAAPAPDGPPPSDVVREAYEPGWYRISAAMPSAAGEANVEDEEEEPATFAGAPASSDADTQDSAVEQPVGEPPPGEPAGPEPEPEPAPEPDHEEPPEPGPEPEEPSAAEPDPEEPAGAVAVGTEEAAEAAASEPLQPVASFQVSEQEEPQAIPDQIPDAQPQPLPHQMADPEPQLAPAGIERMLSRDPAERRAALEAIVGEGITDRHVETVSLLVQDPDRDLRLEALGALAHVADLVQPEVIRKALDDPSDEVRAAAVHLAARRGTADVPEALTFVAERHWPAAQVAALDSAPRLMARSGVSDDVLQRMLRAIGAMDSQPLPHEHDGFVASAQAIGMPQLVASLSASGGAGLGAARLLLAEGSSEAVSALTRHQSHGDSAMQAVVEQAAERLRETAPEPTPESAQLPEESTPQAQEQPTETEAAAESASAAVEEDMLTGLARALEDPGPSVRDRAREALASLGHDQVVPWIQAALSSGEPERMALGARVAGATRQQDLAPALVERALVAPPDTRSVMVRALAELAVAPESYVQLLSSAPSDQRPDAVRLLWQVAGRAVIPQIHAFLEDPSAQVRLAALEVLGESGEPDAAEVARTVLERDSSPVVRATAIRAIARAGLDQRESSLARALSDPDPDVRAMAVEVLPSGFGGHAAQLVLQALSDEDERVWQAAVAQLADTPDRDKAVVWTAILQSPSDRREELLSTLERTNPERLASLALDHLTAPDPQERTLAIALAVRSGTAGGAKGMISALQDPAPGVRRTAVGAVAGVGSPDAIPALAGCLYDPDVEVRVEAVRGLAHIDNDDVLSPLISALKDPEVRVRDVAADALIRWRSPAVARRLVLALTQPSLRRLAGEVLARMGSAAVEPLVDLLLEEGSELSETVGPLLRDLVGPEQFLERLGSMDPAERLRAVEVLGALGDDQGLDGLTRALSDPVESIRIRAVTLLGASGDPRAFDAVKRTFLGDPVEEVVAAAEEALKKLQPGP